MTSVRPAETTIHRAPIRRGRVAGLLLAGTLAAAALGVRVHAPSPSTVPVPGGRHHTLPSEPRIRPGRPPRALGRADGAIPDGTTVFDGAVPGVGRLDAGLLAALRRAANDAAPEGVAFLVDSGWRSRAYQQHLLDEAIARYGSEREAARWVAPPDRSAHVSGNAVDLAPAAAAWLARHGAEYGLCRVYGNEPWHYELRRRAGAAGCPAPYADPTQDPRLQP